MEPGGAGEKTGEGSMGSPHPPTIMRRQEKGTWDPSPADHHEMVGTLSLREREDQIRIVSSRSGPVDTMLIGTSR